MSIFPEVRVQPDKPLAEGPGYSRLARDARVNGLLIDAGYDNVALTDLFRVAGEYLGRGWFMAARVEGVFLRI